jgi:hypothetical protein
MMELPFLPPFRGDMARFTEDEFKEIILFGIPNSWQKEMDKFDFDPFMKTVTELVEFCERMEACDETGRFKDSNTGHKATKKKSKSGKFDKNRTSGNGKKWCDYHETDTHSTKDCDVLKKLKESKSGMSGNSNPAKKQWKSKSKYAKDSQG